MRPRVKEIPPMIKQQADAKQPARVPARGGYANYVFWIMFGINFLNYMDRFILPAVTPQIKAEFHLNDADLGALGTAFLLVYGLAALPLGVWADRGIRKNVVAFGVGLWSLATFFTGFSRNFSQLFASRAILGIGESSYYPAGTSLLSDYYKREDRAQMLSRWNVGSLAGLAVGFSLGGIIADAIGWRWAFYLTGIPGIVFTVLAFGLREPKRGATEVEGVAKETEAAPHGVVSKPGALFREIRQLTRIPTLMIAIASQTLAFFVLGGVSFWLPTFMHEHYRLSLGQAGIFSGVVLVLSGGAGNILGGYAADFMTKRFVSGRMQVVAYSFLLAVPALLVTLISPNLIIFTTFFFLSSAALNLYAGPLSATTQDVTTPVLRSSAVALSLLIAHVLGDAFAPVAIGALSDLIGHQQPDPMGLHLQAAMLYTVPTAMLLAGLVALFSFRHVGPDIETMERQWKMETTGVK